MIDFDKLAEQVKQEDERADTLASLSQWPHELHHVKHLNEYGHDSDVDREPADIDTANVYTSLIAGGPNAGQHTVVIDLDVPARLVPSSTPGHSHLYIDVPMSWRAYKRLLNALESAGVIEPGYYSASLNREHTAVRLPWIKKETPANA